MCDLAAAINPHGNTYGYNYYINGWNCSAGIPPPLVICRWGTVTCNNDLLVTDINLNNRGLTGTLPTTIGRLISMTYWGLVGCNLHGSIPTSIGQMSSLDTLFLDSNKLSGTIPTSIAGLTSMKNLGLGYNKLTGTLPTNIGEMSALSRLGLSNNLFVGFVPPSFCTLHLQSLNIGHSGNPCYSGCLSTITYLNTDISQGVCTSPPTGNI